jgi:myo-inositol 2-dehydrogenase / D-chiro-inositol 1-dehydrogenase
MSEKKQSTRRDFLKGSATVAAGAVIAGQWNIARMAHAAGNEEIKLALIGCGGRGNGAVVDCLNADLGVKVIAVADAFESNARNAAAQLRKQQAARIDLPDERVFAGLDAYEKALATGPDLVILATPPGFRPMMYEAAVKAGMHVFMEKPCCVDAPGFRRVMAANQLAEDKGLRIGCGLQRRHHAGYIETVKRIHDGAIGKINLLRVYWNGTEPWSRQRDPKMSEMEYQVYNWYHFCWLCGDHICEQHVHNLDIGNWVYDKAHDPKVSHPVEANGMGGCSVRYAGRKKGVGQIFDHHFVEFTFPDGTKMLSQCRQIAGTWGSVSEYAHGAEGESNCSSTIQGKNPWKFPAKAPPEMVQEHVDLIQAIRKGEKYCEGWYCATSSMTAVLGRMATYSGQVVRWDEAVEKGTSEFPDKLAWDAKAPVYQQANGDYPMPIPGIYKPF